MYGLQLPIMSKKTPAISKDNFSETNVVYGHNKTQSKDAQWLRVKDIYQKLIKEGDYDIGGTYNGDVADHWFLFRSDHFGDNFILHLFIANRHESSFCIAISSKSDLTHLPTNKYNHVRRSHLPQSLTTQDFKRVPDNTYSFVKSFSFTELEVKQLQDRELFIPVKLSSASSEGMDHNIVQTVKLSHDLGILLKDPMWSDFIIESEDGRKFQVHQAILGAQSEVFKAMLKGDTAESQNHRVKLPLSGDSLECMLQYIYTGEVANLTAHDCRSLLALADHYNLPGLTILVQCALLRQLRADNALEVAALADLYNCESLKNAAFKFVKDNPEVLQTDGWKQFGETDILKKIFEFIHKGNQES